MTDTLEERLSQALKTVQLSDASGLMAGEQLASVARARSRRRRSAAVLSGVVATAVVAGAVGLVVSMGGDRGAGPPVGSPSQTFLGTPPEHPKKGAPTSGPHLTMLWPGDHRPPGGQLHAVVGQPITLRTRLHFAQEPIRWVQLFVTHPNALGGSETPPGALKHQPASSRRVFGAEADNGLLVSLTWTPTQPGSYHVTYIVRYAGVSGGNLATILVRPAS